MPICLTSQWRRSQRHLCDDVTHTRDVRQHIKRRQQGLLHLGGPWWRQWRHIPHENCTLTWRHSRWVANVRLHGYLLPSCSCQHSCSSWARRTIILRQISNLKKALVWRETCMFLQVKYKFITHSFLFLFLILHLFLSTPKPPFHRYYRNWTL